MRRKVNRRRRHCAGLKHHAFTSQAGDSLPEAAAFSGEIDPRRGIKASCKLINLDLSCRLQEYLYNPYRRGDRPYNSDGDCAYFVKSRMFY